LQLRAQVQDWQSWPRPVPAGRSARAGSPPARRVARAPRRRQLFQPLHQIAEGAIGQQDAADADGHRRRRAVSRNERGRQPEQGHDEPAARHQGLQHRRSVVQILRRAQVALQGLVLPLVPAGAGFLGQPRAVAEHALHQIVGHLQPFVRPPAAAAIVAQAEHGRDGDRAQEQKRQAPAPRPRAEDEAGQGQLDHGRQADETALQRRGLDHLGLDHPAEELSGALVADRIGVQAHGPEEEPPLEQGTGLNGEEAAGRSGKKTKRDGR